MADGIHVVGGSRNVTVSHNVADNTGDDSFAAVAYATLAQTLGVTISGNTSTNSKARGVTCIGAANCLIEDNTVANPRGHGIVVAYDKAYNTYRPTGAKVIGNKIEGVNGGGKESILIEDADGVELSKNSVARSRSIYVLRSKNVSLTAFDVRDSIGPAILIRDSQDVHILSSHIYRAGGPGIAFDHVTGGEISTNVLEDDKNAETGPLGDIDIVRSTSISGDRNKSTNSSNPASKLIGVIDSDAHVNVSSQ
jgi:nitrous oxidase accessory protein NosD